VLALALALALELALELACFGANAAPTSPNPVVFSCFLDRLAHSPHP